MRIQVGRWGKSLAIRLPQALATRAGIDEGTVLNAELHNNEVVLRLDTPRRSLDQLLEGISKENLHAETDWGGARGAEAW